MISSINLYLVSLALLNVCICQTEIPAFVLRYAPLVYLDVNDYYLPSDIGSQLSHTRPSLNFDPITSGPDPDLANLSSFNDAGDCTVDNFGACDVYLTGRDIPSYPPWLNGTLPNPDTGKTEGARSCAVIVVDHGSGIVDAFYMYFYAFDLGYDFGGTLFGNHVGDWEHTMIRFEDGQPSTVWYSQHDTGAVYTWDALQKTDSRPHVYSAFGTHANYPVPGNHSREVSIVTIDDLTSIGPLWDPILSAYFYSFTPTSDVNGTFAPLTSSNMDIDIASTTPSDWLHFLGKWGDKQYRDSDVAQNDIAGVVRTWEDGPTGPLDKQLNRSETCPDDEIPCVTSTALPAITGDANPVQTIVRMPSRGGSGGGGAGGGGGGRRQEGDSNEDNPNDVSSRKWSLQKNGALLLAEAAAIALFCIY